VLEESNYETEIEVLKAPELALLGRVPIITGNGPGSGGPEQCERGIYV
jgi:hypothetical protein